PPIPRSWRERKGAFRAEQATFTLATIMQPNSMHCLVVDDEPRLRRVLVRLLEGEGFTCREAGSGTEAIAMLEQQSAPLVISYLRGHSVRVANYAFRVGRELGLEPGVLDMISLGAELHDLGKIGVSEAVLHKPGKLSEAEYRHIMDHPVIGARILGPLMRDAPA